jgi:hypothetical protein
MLVYTAFSMTAIHMTTSNILTEDWDLLLPTYEWGFDEGRMVPDKLMGVPGNEYNWYCNVYPAEAINSSNAQFASHDLSKFITVLITDGGMHRLGETPADREAFLSKSFISTKNANRLSFVLVIKMQEPSFNAMLTKLGIKFSKIETKENYDGAFEYMTSLINAFNRGGK